MNEDVERDEAERLSRRRLALVQMALGVPMLLVVLGGVVVAWGMSGRSLGGGVFWGVIASVGAVFALYYAHAFLVLRRTRREGRGERSCASPEEDAPAGGAQKG